MIESENFFRKGSGFITTHHILIILLIFFGLCLVKGFFSLSYPSVGLFPDEVCYDKKAQNIIGGQFFLRPADYTDVPFGYPAILSLAYLFIDNKEIIYHIILLINVILTSVTIFPAFFILKRFCSPVIAILGSLLVSTSSSLNAYYLLIMSENLFSFVFILFLFILLLYLESKKMIFLILSLFLIFSLMVIRSIGISLLIGFSIVFGLIAILSLIKYSGITMDKKQSLIIFGVFALPIFYIFNIIFLKFQHFEVDYSYYSLNLLIDTSDIFGSFKLLFRNLSGSLDYFIIQSYIIIFWAICVSIALFIIPIIRKTNGKIKNIFEKLIKQISCSNFAILFIYLLVTTIIWGGMVLFHQRLMQEMISSPYFIYGRAFDPIIPAWLLMGVIFFERLLKREISFTSCSLSYIGLVFLLLITLPSNYAPYHEITAIWYLHLFSTPFFAHDQFINPVAFLILLSLFLLVLLWFKRSSAISILIIIILISIFSTICAVTFWQGLAQTNIISKNNLQEITGLPENSDIQILFDMNVKDENKRIQMYFLFLLTEFWYDDSNEIRMFYYDPNNEEYPIKKSLIHNGREFYYYPVDIQNLKQFSNFTYIISDQQFPAQIVGIVNHGYTYNVYIL